MYGELYDDRLADLEAGKVKKTKKRINELNTLLRDSIENATAVAKTLTASEEKFDYLQAILNMELSCASRYGKITETEIDKGIENMKNSLAAYKRARLYVDDYKKKKEFKSDKELEDTL